MAEGEAPHGAPPDFLGELTEEVREFFRVLAHFTRSPIAFGREWSEGRLQAMNPIGFFGTAVGLQLGAIAIVVHFKPDTKVAPASSWLLDLLSSQIPLLRAAVFATILHAWLSRRSHRPFRASLGVVLYATGWAAIIAALAAPLPRLFPGGFTQGLPLLISLIKLFMLGLALTGVHRLRRWTSALAPMLLGGVLVVILSKVVTDLMVRLSR